MPDALQGGGEPLSDEEWLDDVVRRLREWPEARKSFDSIGARVLADAIDALRERAERAEGEANRVLAEEREWFRAALSAERGATRQLREAVSEWKTTDAEYNLAAANADVHGLVRAAERLKNCRENLIAALSATPEPSPPEAPQP